MIFYNLGQLGYFWGKKMISKLVKAQENWLFKLIFIAVAISFISLFGVTGYINTAAQNQDIVNVGGKKTSQNEFSFRVQKELNAIKNIAGEDFEVSDELSNSITEGVLRQIIEESVLDQTMNRYNVNFPKEFIRQVIFTQPEFTNPLTGQFSREAYNRYLSISGLSESGYVEIIKRVMARKMLIDDLVKSFNIPSILTKAVHKMDNQRKSFKYVLVSPEDVKIERQISEDEIQQYFEDFAETFIIPETRDAEVLYIPIDTILNKYATSEDMVADYYSANKTSFDKPEKRDVLQMVFMDEETANKALAEVNTGKSFADVALSLSAENSNNTELGVVALDELADDLGVVFDMEINKPEVIQVADTWQVVMVKQIIPAKESTFEEVKNDIINELKNENMYDAIREAKAEIDDAIGAGEDLDAIANKFGVQSVKINNVKETVLIDGLPENLKSLGNNLSLNELVFSYSLDETTSAEEFDEAIVVAKVVNIVDEHMPNIADVKDRIVQIWLEQEKNALAKEIAEDIIADVSDDMQIADAAKARNLEMFRSEPISRNDTFANLLPSEINDLFLAADGEVKLFERVGNSFIIVVPFETVNYDNELTDEALNDIENRAEASIVSDMAKAMLDSYASDFKIEVDYKRAGFTE